MTGITTIAQYIVASTGIIQILSSNINIIRTNSINKTTTVHSKIIRITEPESDEDHRILNRVATKLINVIIVIGIVMDFKMDYIIINILIFIYMDSICLHALINVCSD